MRKISYLVSSSPAIHIILIVLIGIAACWNAFRVPFVFDDSMFILDNPTVKDFSYIADTSKADSLHLKDVVRRYLETRYIGYLSFWLNYVFSGLKVSTYHAVNLAIHIMNAVLIYFFIYLTVKTPFLKGSLLSGRASLISFISAVLFISHPVEAETVTYISERFVSLSALFMMISLTAYAGSRLAEKRASRYILYSICLMASVLAMKTKETAFTLPVIISLYEFIFFRDNAKKRMMLLLPIIMTMLIIPVHYIEENIGGNDISAAIEKSTRLQSNMPRMQYLFTEFRVIITYLRLLVFPINLNIDYDYPPYFSFFDLHVLLSFVILLGLFSAGIYFLFRSSDKPEMKPIAFGIFFFFISLSVESGLIPISEFIEEYRMYLPSVGIFISMSVGSLLIFQKIGSRIKSVIATSIFVLIPILLSVSAYERNTVWKNDLSLWKDVVFKSPQKARGHNNLGVAYAQRGMTDLAIEQYLIAINIKPDFASAYNNLGNAYKSKGDIDRAIASYKEAVILMPDLAEAHNSIAVAYGIKGMMDKAVEHLKAAIELKPYYVDAHYNLGFAYHESGLPSEAFREFSIAIKLDPTYEKAKAFVK